MTPPQSTQAPGPASTTFAARTTPGGAAHARQGPQRRSVAPRRATVVAGAAVVALGAIQAWSARHTMSPDGISYIDLSDAVVSGHLSRLVSGYWSPLYPLLIGLVRLVLAPTALASAYWEFAVVHLVNVVILAASVPAYAWFIAELRRSATAWGADTGAALLESGWGCAGVWSFFAATSLGMTSVTGTTPDLLVNVFVYCIFACLLRLARAPRDTRAALWLGVFLGGAALAKSFFFPLSLVVFAIVAVRAWRATRAARALLVSGGAWLVLVLPWVAALSVAQGHATFGETGRLAYAWYVDDEQPPNTGALPAAALSHDPAAGAFNVAVVGDAPGTDPLWYDPVRWHGNLKTQFSAVKQLRVLTWYARFYGVVLAPLLMLLVVAGASMRYTAVREVVGRTWMVAVPCVAALAAYGLVYSALRYIAAFVTVLGVAVTVAVLDELEERAVAVLTAGALLVLDVIAAPARPAVLTYNIAAMAVIAVLLATRHRPRVVQGVFAIATASVLMALMHQLPGRQLALLAAIVTTALWAAWRRSRPASGRFGALAFAASMVVVFAAPPAVEEYRTFAHLADGTPPAMVHPSWTIARELSRAGVVEGSRIALVGDHDAAYWARSARLHITATIRAKDAPAFWALPDSAREPLLKLLFRDGAQAIVVTQAPRDLPAGWTAVAGGAVLTRARGAR